MNFSYFKRIISFVFDWKKFGIVQASFFMIVCIMLAIKNLMLWYIMFGLFISAIIFTFDLLSAKNRWFYFILVFLIIIFTQIIIVKQEAAQNVNHYFEQKIFLSLSRKSIVQIGKNKYLVMYQDKTGMRFVVWIDRNEMVPSKIEGEFEIEKPQESRNPGGYNQAKFLANQNCFAIAKPVQAKMQYSKWSRVHSIKQQHLNSFNEWLKLSFNQEIADFILSFCFGQKHFMKDDWKQFFSGLGLQHVLAVSGFHFELFLFPFTKLISKKKKKSNAMLLSMFSLILLFLWISDYPIGLVRASLQFFIQNLALKKHIFISKKDSMLLAMLICLFVSPFLAIQLGFQLSFGISFLIYIVSPRLQSIQIFSKSKILFSIALNFIVQILLFPFLMLTFNQSVLSTFLLNTIVTIPFCIAFMSGYVLMIRYLFTAIFSLEIFLLKSVIKSYYSLLLFVIKKIGLSKINRLFQMNYANVLSQIILIILIFSGIFYLIKFFQTISLKNRSFYIVNKKLIVYIIALCLTFFSWQYQFEWKVIFLDVGQGDSCLIISPDKRTLLIDGGNIGNGYHVIIPALKHYGISQIDYAILSHLDIDHCGGVYELLEMNMVNELILPEGILYAQRDSDYLQTRLRELIKNNQIIFHEKKAGDILHFSKLNLNAKILSPDKFNLYHQNSNDQSFTFRLNIEGLSILFTGDITDKVEEKLIRNPELSFTDILKISHHGSKGSTSNAFLSATNPTLGIISVGRNFYGHPNKEVLERLKKHHIEMKRTDKNGAIVLELINNSWEVSTYLE